jgi:hypothetical protein
MTHPTHAGDGQAVFDREFTLLNDLIGRGSNPAMASLQSDLADAEFERAQAESKARTAQAQATRLAQQLEQTTAERGGALRQLAEGNVREGELNRAVLGLRFELGEAGRERELLREALARVVAAVMDGAADPLTGALDTLEAAGGVLPALASRTRLAVAA